MGKREFIANFVSMNKLFPILLMLAASTAAYSQTFTDSGYTYTITDDSAHTLRIDRVNDKENLAAELVVSGTVKYEDTEYTVTEIGNGAFRDCVTVASLTLPATITAIGDGAFQRCAGLKEMILSNNMTELGDYVFEACTALTKITLPSTLTVIPDGLCRDCSSLTEISIPSKLTGIGNMAFINCRSLNKLKFPDTLTYIGDDAFGNCTGLTDLDFSECAATIGQRAFAHCSGLSKIQLKKVTTVDDEAFMACSGLTYVAIYETMFSMKGRVFNNCDNLNTIYSWSDEPCSITATTFDRSTLHTAKLMIPYDSEPLYSQTMYWQEFYSIIPTFIDPDGVDGVDNIYLGNNVTVNGLKLTISGLHGKISVVSTDGKCVFNGTCDQETIISLPTAGVYLIVTSKGTSKIMAI